MRSIPALALSLLVFVATAQGQSKVSAVESVTPEEAARVRAEVRAKLVDLATELTNEEPEEAKVTSLLQSLSAISGSLPKAAAAMSGPKSCSALGDAVATLQSTWRNSQRYLVHSPTDYETARAALSRSAGIMTKEQVKTLRETLNARLQELGGE